MSVLDGFKEVGERTGGKLTMTVMLESVRFSKGVSEVLGRPEFVKLLVNYERGKFAIQVCDENDDFAVQFNNPNADRPASVTTAILTCLLQRRSSSLSRKCLQTRSPTLLWKVNITAMSA